MNLNFLSILAISSYVAFPQVLTAIKFNDPRLLVGLLILPLLFGGMHAEKKGKNVLSWILILSSIIPLLLSLKQLSIHI